MEKFLQKNSQHRALTLFLIVFALSSQVFAQVPVIHSFTPAFGAVGASVTITGSNFSKNLDGNAVYFGGVKAAVTRAADTSLTVTVPDGATSAPITVTTHYLTGYSLQPFVLSVPGGPLTLTSNSFVKGADIKADTTEGLGGIVVADIDGDGKPDMVTCSDGYLSPNIGILLNSGSPGKFSFDTPVFLHSPTNSVSASVRTADLDGDGKLDIVVLSAGIAIGQYISVFRNTSTPGNVSFAPRIDLSSINLTTLVIRDLNGDGKPEIVSTGGVNYAVIFTNQSSPGTISFMPAVLFPSLGGDPISIDAADLDGDGKPDLAVANLDANFNGPYTISLLYNKSTYYSIDFSDATTIDPGSPSPYSIALYDLDGDNKPDIVLTHLVNTGDTTNYCMTIYRNNSTPGVFSFTKVATNYGHEGGVSISIADISGDGKPDIVLIPNGPGAPSPTAHINVYQNTSTLGNISFSNPVTFYYGNLEPGQTAISDLDGDNLPDLAVTHMIFNSFVSIFNNNDTVPALAGFSPAIADSATTVTISGINLTGASAVSFGGVPATSFSVVSPGTIKAVPGPGASGEVAVTVSGKNISMPGFTYASSPVITAINPTAAPPGGTVVITGKNFTGATSVSIGGTPASSFVINSSSSITAIVGSGQTGDVEVTTAIGDAAFSGFTFLGPSSISADGATRFCQGDYVVLSSSSPSSNQWYKNDTAIAGATDEVLYVYASGNYTVKTSFAGSTTAPSNEIAVTVNSIPAKPTIQNNGIGLLSSASSGNQWYTYNNGIIPGATGQFYTPSDSGYYSVVVTLNGCSSVAAAGFYYNLDSVMAKNNVRIVPNPVTSNQIEVVFSFAGVSTVTAEITDLNGGILLRQDNVHSGDKINLSGIKSGMYVLKLFGSNGRPYSTTSFIKL